jgi:uncharacterized protein involved in high-affinity Fe2+ transport
MNENSSYLFVCLAFIALGVASRIEEREPMFRMQNGLRLVMVLGLTSMALNAFALEFPVGKPKEAAGMEIAAVYLQPIEMEPDGMMRKVVESDVHFEADIHALASNKNGFVEGMWMPYLHIRYELTKLPGGEKISGDFMPMVASDGPHYGDNVKLMGVGKYHLKYTIYPPGAKENTTGGMYFGRHVDRATGVAPWFKPFAVEWDFTFAGVGKKGGY